MSYDEFDLPDKKRIRDLVEDFELYLKKDELPFWTVEDFLDIADYYLEKNEDSKITLVLEIASGIYEHNFDITLKIAEVYLGKNKLNLALEFAQKAFDLEPNNPDVSFLRAEIYDELGDFTNAEKYYQQIIDLHLGNKDILLDAYYSYLGLLQKFGMFEQAFSLFKKIIPIFPNEQVLLDELYILSSVEKKEVEAEEFVSELLKEDTLNPNLWFFLGTLYRHMGVLDKALDAFDNVLCIKSDNEYALMEIVYIYLEQKKPDEALMFINQISESHKEIEESQITLAFANAYELKEDFENSKQYYLKTIVEDSTCDDAWHGVGYAFYKEGRHKMSIEYFERAIELEAEIYYYWEDYARCLQSIGRLKDAEKAYKTATDLYPFSVIGWIDYARFYYEIDEKDNALDVIQNAIDHNPERSELLFQKAALLLITGQIKNGTLLLEYGLENNPKQKDWLFYHYAELSENVDVLKLFSKYNRINEF